MAKVDTVRNHCLLLHEQLAHLHDGNTQKEVSNISSDEDILENNYMFVMLCNLCVISHLIFPQCSFSISGTKYKNNLKRLRTLLREHQQ